jgi:hypothetical protein
VPQGRLVQRLERASGRTGLGVTGDQRIIRTGVQNEVDRLNARFASERVDVLVMPCPELAGRRDIRLRVTDLETGRTSFVSPPRRSLACNTSRRLGWDYEWTYAHAWGPARRLARKMLRRYIRSRGVDVVDSTLVWKE